MRDLTSPFWEGLAKAIGLFWFVLVGSLIVAAVRTAPVVTQEYKIAAVHTLGVMGIIYGAHLVARDTFTVWHAIVAVPAFICLMIAVLSGAI